MIKSGLYMSLTVSVTSQMATGRSLCAHGVLKKHLLIAKLDGQFWKYMGLVNCTL